MVRLYAFVVAATVGVWIIGTTAGWLVPEVRALGVAIIGIAILGWAYAISRGLDAIDGAAILLVVALGAGTVTSMLPRISAEASYAALGYAALFGLVRRLDDSGRADALRAMALLFAVVVTAFFAWWSIAWVEWVRTTGLAPSLAMELPSGPFGQRHNVALLVGLLAPAGFVAFGRGRARQIAVSILIGMSAMLIFMSGGRAVWLGVGVATTVVLVAHSGTRTALFGSGGRRATLAAMAVVLAAFVVISGLAESLLVRALTTESLDMRGAIWGSSFDAWLRRPALGTGLGTFQFAIGAEGYFDRSVFAPKHADSLYVQTISEAGIAGLALLASIAVLIVRTWRTKPPPAHVVWPLVFVLVTGIGANAASSGYTALVATFWAGMSAPISMRSWPRMRSRRALAAVPIALLIIGAVPVWTTTSAVFAYDRARALGEVGEVDGVINALTDAMRGDQTHPLYPRERGIALLIDGQIERAIEDLQHATLLNPLDDTSFRALAVAELAAGQTERAHAAARTATFLQTTDPMNQAALALTARRETVETPGMDALVHLLVLTPWAAADASWSALFPAVQPSDAIEAAARLMVDRPVLDTIDPRWTTALARAAAVNQGTGFSLPQEAMALALDCRLASAQRLMREATPAARADPEFAFVSSVVASLGGEPHDTLEIPPDPVAGPLLGDPVGDQARYARRSPAHASDIEVPTTNGGRLRWLQEPEAALRAVRGSACP